MKKVLIKVVLLTGIGFLSCQVFAANLMAVYQDALANDPTFKMARSNWQAQKENIAINRAGLLPTFDVGANYERDYNENVVATAVTQDTVDEYYNNTGGYQLDIKQPIFNYKNWATLSKAKAGEKQSAAEYSAAAQKLIFRTADAYFNVLNAQDVLRYTGAEKRAFRSQLERARQRYRVGLATITDVRQAQAKYDTTVAEEIKNRNDLAVEKEKLREITNNHYKSFARLTAKLPLLYPNPTDIDQWIRVAQDQNYDLLAARFGAEAAQENIKVKAADHLPVITAEGHYEYVHGDNILGIKKGNNIKGTIGLNATLPVFEGGGTVAQTNQAEYQYQNATEMLEKTNRTVVSDTRQYYLGVISYANTVKADKQAVLSTQTSLQSTQASYYVGTQTMTDVLDAETDLYGALKTYATDQYQYIIQTVSLKYAAGTLSENDLAEINSWLQAKSTVPVTHKKAKTVTKKKTTAKRATHKTKYKVKSSTATQQVKKINPKHHTIQLLATRNTKAITNFKKQHKLPDKTYTVRIKKNGQTWYELIMGDYATTSQAKVAFAKLPAKVKAGKPWIRNYASVQKAMY